MKKLSFKLIYIPHALTIFTALFLLIFSFDVFGGPESLWEQVIGFLIHSIPTYLVLAVFFIARKKVVVGASVSFGLFFMFTFRFQTYSSGLENFVIISMPLLIIALLYLLVHFIEDNKVEKKYIFSLSTIVIVLVLLSVGYIVYGIFTDVGDEIKEEVDLPEADVIMLADPEQVIHFEDKVFESEIRDCFDLGDGEIKWKDIGYRIELDSEEFQPSGRIETLDDLKWFVNLRKIEMQEYEVEGDLSSLSGLKNLEMLLMWDTQVSGDISSLSELENLRYLNLSGTNIEGDISSLSGLTNLKELELNRTNVEGNRSSLSELEELEVLKLRDTQVTDE